ncbi:MAG: glycosyltransferase, partial [Acetobacteraceae bacterium]|nr:glycosyltransferase [Acetobacteraceae bacterium]
PADDLGDVARRAPAETRAEPPLVSVCIGTHNRAEPLARAVASIEAQSWPRIELIVADDASTAPEARAFLDALEPRLARRGGRLLRNATNLYNGGNRNRAVAEARGEFVLLMDDDNAAFPEEVESFVTAALHSGADVLTCQQQVFAGPGAPPEARMRRPVGFTPIGPNIPQGVFENCLGDANMFVRRDAYLGIGGTDTARAGFEDWEFLLRAALRGLKVECLPVILFRYRVWDSGQILGFDHDALVRSHRRVLETALREVPEALRPALRLAAETRLHRMADRGEGHWGRVGPVSTE